MENKTKFRPDPKAKLMDQMKEVLRYHHYSYRTETTYCQWILRYIRYHGGKTHPREMGKQQIEAFLSNLVTQGNVAPSTQRQALNALVFLYREVLDMPVDGDLMPIRSKKKIHPPNGSDAGRSSRDVSENGRNPFINGKTVVWKRITPDGMYPLTDTGC